MAAGSGRSGTRRGTRRGTSGRSGTRRSTSGRSTAGRSGVAAARRSTATVLLHLRHADLAEHVAETALLRLAAGVARIATGNRSRSTARRSGRSTSDRSRSTGSRSGTRRGTSRRSGTSRGGRAAARGRGTAACSLTEQAGIGAVQAGETHKGSGNPCELHLKTPRYPSGREREALCHHPIGTHHPDGWQSDRKTFASLP